MMRDEPPQDDDVEWVVGGKHAGERIEADGRPLVWMFVGFLILMGLAKLVTWFPWLWQM